MHFRVYSWLFCKSAFIVSDDLRRRLKVQSTHTNIVLRPGPRVSSLPFADPHGSHFPEGDRRASVGAGSPVLGARNLMSTMRARQGQSIELNLDLLDRDFITPWIMAINRIVKECIVYSIDFVNSIAIYNRLDTVRSITFANVICCRCPGCGFFCQD